AGVSTAAVDRVLNHRPGVRPATVQSVLKAAAQLGYLPQDDLYKALRPQPLRLTYILPAGTNRFLNMLGDYVDIAHEQFEPFNVQCRCRYVEGFNPQVLVDTLLREGRSEEHTSELQSRENLVCRLLLEKKKKNE